MRRLVNRGFTPRAVNAMEPRIREIAASILDRLGDRTECDFVLDVASQLPLAVICGLMGIPEEHWPLMFQLTNQTLGAADPEYQAGRRARRRAWHGHRANPHRARRASQDDGLLPLAAGGTPQDARRRPGQRAARIGN